MMDVMATRSPAPAPEDVLAQLRAKLAETEAVAPRPLPVHPALAAVLPDAGLRPGSAYSLTGPGALLLALLAEPSTAGYWCGVIGLPELGAEAAELAGVKLDRLVLVPDPGNRWLSVTAALIEVLPVVAVCPNGRISSADAARLAARLRDREAVLLVTGDWPQSRARISLTEPTWSGLGDGHGYLTCREVTLTVTGRQLPTPRSARLLLPDPNGSLSSHDRDSTPARLQVAG